MIFSRNTIFIALLFGAVVLMTASTTVSARDLPKVGLIEDVHLDGVKIDFRAKIDTGAKTSSINARDIKVFKKDGNSWVSFSLVNIKGKRITLKRPVYRFARIRRSGAKVDKRVVVELWMCLGHLHKQAQFTLKNRKRMNYAMLIGRRVLNNNFFVDSAKKDLTVPKCKKK